MKPQNIHIEVRLTPETTPKKKGYYRTKEEGTSYWDGTCWYDHETGMVQRFPQTIIVEQKESFVFTKEELYEFVNKVMQAKDDMNLREKRVTESFTPAYQVNEFFKKEGIQIFDI